MTTSGPLFDARAQLAVERFKLDATRAVVDAALSRVQANLNESIQYPTPYYETQIWTHPIPNGQQVDDRGVIYGHWLEGDGSRNAPRTRFRGYHSFQRAFEAVVSRVDQLTDSARSRLMRELSGE